VNKQEQGDEKDARNDSVGGLHVAIHVEVPRVKSHGLESGEDGDEDVVVAGEVEVNSAVIVQVIILDSHANVNGVAAESSFWALEGARSTPVRPLDRPVSAVNWLFCVSASAVLAVCEHIDADYCVQKQHEQKQQTHRGQGGQRLEQSYYVPL